MLIPAKEYQARAIEWKCSESKNTRSLCIVALFEVTKGEYAGQIVQWRGWLTPDAIDRTLEQAKATGFTGRGKLSALEGFGSKPCIIDVKHETAIGRDNAPFTVARAAWLKALPTLDGFDGAPADLVDRIGASRMQPSRSATSANGTAGAPEQEPGDAFEAYGPDDVGEPPPGF